MRYPTTNLSTHIKKNMSCYVTGLEVLLFVTSSSQGDDGLSEDFSNSELQVQIGWFDRCFWRP